MKKLADYARLTKKVSAKRREESTGINKPLQRPAVDAIVPVPERGLRIAVLPDVQAKEGVPLDHLAAYGQYIAEKQPDGIVCIGDFADMPSLSSYDIGKRSFEGRRYRKDVDAAKRAMGTFLTPIAKVPGYKPWLKLTLGNHEDRITRAIEGDPKLDGTLSLDDLEYKNFGWEVYPFLQPVVVGGVAFCHYFPSGIMGRPTMSARQILNKLHMSAYAGHQQGRDIAYAKRADGGDLTAIISGSFYQHEESYLSPFTNKHWRGAYFLHQVKDGAFDEMALSLEYLLYRFGKKA